MISECPSYQPPKSPKEDSVQQFLSTHVQWGLHLDPHSGATLSSQVQCKLWRL